MTGGWAGKNMPMAGMEPQRSMLEDLETSIQAAMLNLNSLDEFALTEQTDNDRLALNVHQLVDNLSHIRSASAQANVAVPYEIVHAYVDAGRPPDAFMVQQDARGAAAGTFERGPSLQAGGHGPCRHLR